MLYSESINFFLMTVPWGLILFLICELNHIQKDILVVLFSMLLGSTVLYIEGGLISEGDCSFGRREIAEYIVYGTLIGGVIICIIEMAGMGT